MLNLFDKNAVVKVTICETEFVIKSLPLTEKEKLVSELAGMNSAPADDRGYFERVIDLMTPAIVEINVPGYSTNNPADVLRAVTDMKQFTEIIKGFIASLGLTADAAKNLESLPE